MKKILMIIAVLLLTVNSWAFPIKPGDTVLMDANWGDNYGMMSVTDGKIYDTFCLEAHITFSNDTPYFVESVGGVAVSGGNTSTFETINSISATDGTAFVAFGDPVADETYWLYAGYFDGLFSAFGTGQTLINKVQYAIWFSEEEVPIGSVGELYYNELIAIAKGDYKYTGWDLRVVNIVGGPDKDRQSQLVGNPVPEPATMLLFGFGLMGIAAFARKNQR